MRSKSYASVRPSDRRLLDSARHEALTRIVVAPRISEAAARELEAAGLSWAALDGPAHISAPGILIRVLRRPPGPRKAEGRVQSAFSWTAVTRDVAEYVLTRVPPELGEAASIPLPRTEDVADAVRHSQAAVAKTMRGLAGRGWLRKPGAQRGRGSRWELVDPTGLLDHWAADRPPPVEVLAHGLVGDHLEFARGRIAEVIPPGEWCLAGTSASQLIAPLLTSAPVLECGVSRDVARGLGPVLDALELREVDRGHRIRFVTVPHVSLATSREIAGLPVASPVRTYADVLALAGRGADIAARVRQVALGF